MLFAWVSLPNSGDTSYIWMVTQLHLFAQLLFCSDRFQCSLLRHFFPFLPGTVQLPARPADARLLRMVCEQDTRIAERLALPAVQPNGSRAQQLGQLSLVELPGLVPMRCYDLLPTCVVVCCLCVQPS